jgi:hypothetical protein
MSLVWRLPDQSLFFKTRAKCRVRIMTVERVRPPPDGKTADWPRPEGLR